MSTEPLPDVPFRETARADGIPVDHRLEEWGPWLTITEADLRGQIRTILVHLNSDLPVDAANHHAAPLRRWVADGARVGLEGPRITPALIRLLLIEEICHLYEHPSGAATAHRIFEESVMGLTAS